jgi:hypothetical protein
MNPDTRLHSMFIHLSFELRNQLTSLGIGTRGTRPLWYVSCDVLYNNPAYRVDLRHIQAFSRLAFNASQHTRSF